MKNKKVLGLLLSLAFVLGVALPATLAISMDSESKGGDFSIGTANENERNSNESLLVDENTALTTRENIGTPSDANLGAGVENIGTPSDADSVADNESIGTPSNAKKPDHIDTCLEGCTGEGCQCPCHKLGLYERLMACTSLEEFDMVLEETIEEEFVALTDEENMGIKEHIDFLEKERLLAIMIEVSDNESVISEIMYPTVSFSNVAPFGSPVVGRAK
jgi:hypothetical protein